MAPSQQLGRRGKPHFVHGDAILFVCLLDQAVFLRVPVVHTFVRAKQTVSRKCSKSFPNGCRHATLAHFRCNAGKCHFISVDCVVLIRHLVNPVFARDLWCLLAIPSTHARRPYLSGLSILWSPPLICRFAHSIRVTLSATPIFCRMSCIMRRNVVGSIRRSLHTCLSVLPPARARNMIDSSLVKVASIRKPELRLMLITLGSFFIGLRER